MNWNNEFRKGDRVVMTIKSPVKSVMSRPESTTINSVGWKTSVHKIINDEWFQNENGMYYRIDCFEILK